MAHIYLCPPSLHLGVRVKICNFRLRSLTGKLEGVETRSEGQVSRKWPEYKEKVAATFTQTEDFILRVCGYLPACMCVPYVCLAPMGTTRRNQITWD